MSATYYINADSGNDTTGDGSSGSPWLTENKAYTSSTTGDTIVFQDATATYAWYHASGSGGESRSNRTWEGESSDASGAIIDGGNLSGRWKMDGTWKFKNLTWQNFNAASAGNTGPLFNLAVNSSTVATVENCVFNDLTVISATGTFTNGLFGRRIDGDATADPVTFNMSNCLFYNIKKSSAASDGYIFGWYQINNLTSNINNITVDFSVEGGTIALNKFQEIRLGSQNTTMYQNCILYNATGGTINYEDASANQMKYSCIYNMTGPPTETGTATNITSDPLFVDASNINFNLRPTSPCINTGVLI